MYFYSEKEKTFEKYQVSYDEELIKKLREEIINNCSLIEHCEYDSTIEPYSFRIKSDDYCIKNYSERFVGVRESRDNLQYPDEDIYHYSYDKYIYPQLVLYIDEFLDGNVQIIEMAPEITNVTTFFQKQIDNLIQEIDSVDNLGFEQKIKKLEELKKITEQAELNKNQKSTEKYLEKFNELVRIKLVDILQKEEIDRVNAFYERKTQYKVKAKSRTLKK